MSESHRGLVPSAETCRKLSDASRGRRHTEETRQKLRDRTVSVETRAKLSVAMKGKNLGNTNGLGYRHTPKVRAEMSARLVGNSRALGHCRSEESIAKTMSHPFWHGHGRGSTSLERNLYVLLEGAGYQVERQVRFGRYVVDAWLPEQCLVFEADGMFWYHHQDADREARRDAYLLAHGAVAVVHLTDDDLKHILIG